MWKATLAAFQSPLNVNHRSAAAPPERPPYTMAARARTTKGGKKPMAVWDHVAISGQRLLATMRV